MRVRHAVPLALFCGSSLILGACGSGAPVPTTPSATGEKKHATRSLGRSDVDYVAIGPRVLLTAIEPLLAYRQTRGLVVERIALEDLTPPSATDKDATAPIQNAIHEVAARSGKRLRFVLLVGDVAGFNEAPSGNLLLPTFYRPKLGYENHDPLEHEHEAGHDEHEHEHRMRRRGEEEYATDLPYAHAHVDAPGQPELASTKSPTPLAVGRVPAQYAEEAAAFARKVIHYETAQSEGSWRRSIAIFSGPANFGPLADFLIENTMTRMLDEKVPYDWDVEIVVPKLGSPWAYPFPQLQEKLISRLDAGALIAGYVGHGAPNRFDDVHFQHQWYQIGTSWDLKRLNIGDGKPFFLSITCDNGFFDLPRGRQSIAETLVLNPNGAIAVFASSRESHPYPNALYGDALVQTFIAERAPSIGEGIVVTKQRMRDGNVPLAPLLFQSDPGELAEEHMGLYNLFGDPATVLQYPAKVDLTIDQTSSPLPPGSIATIHVDTKDIPTGKALLTVETRRSVVRATVQSADALKAMPNDEAWETMRKTYEAATNKVVSQDEQTLANGHATFRVKLPDEPGEYAIKVLVAGNGDTAAGHVKVKVAKPPAP